MTVTADEGILARPQRSATTDSRRQQLAVASLLLVAGLVYIWALDRNGFANAYYSAAVQAGQQDLKAFIFGSADWGNSVTVDKPPLSLWVIGLSVRLFGLNPWALMLPQALITLSSAILSYRLMRRCFPFTPSLLATAVFAFTPITVLLARYNNPDPLMVLLMGVSLYAGIRATESGKFRYLALLAALLSLGFLTKQLQAFLVLPALVTTFSLLSRIRWQKRIVSISAMGFLLGVGSLAWPLYVDMTPASDRPYIGGSTTNSMLELILGYNGVDRVMQHSDAPSASLIPAQFRSVDTDAGFFRLINLNYGQEIGWLLLPGLISCTAVIICLLRRRLARKQSILACAAAMWMATTYFMLSFMGANFHSYYTASLAFPMALCIGVGADLLQRNLSTTTSRVMVAASLVASVIFSKALWQSSTDYPEWLGNAAFFSGVLASAVLAIPPPSRWMVRFALGLAFASLMAGPVVCSIMTASTPQEGSNPMSGGVTKSPNTLSRFLKGVKEQDPAWASGVAIGMKPSLRMTDLLQNASPLCTWAAATYPGQTASQFQLHIGRPVMSLGGFAGVDPNPNLNQFKEWVSSGKVCYLVEQVEQLKVPGNSGELIAIQAWAKENFRTEQIDGVTVYDLSN
ncbi:ArnT family glycosyltransferase [Pseudarthrobacter chlorophenolicus]|uniref:ArnT family glycosyltransferase n=1 Tax=Pseudarthrobacter chlorophenolicus TaxID=85085 RepID=UPI0005F2F649|nr:glycosyltransferase family 39 protein [Pseudarthrobacter chlorophenolicus]